MIGKTLLFASVASVVGTGTATADPAMKESATETPSAYSYAWMDPRLVSQIGIGMQIGGGISGFTDQTLRDTVTSNVSGLWTARATVGTHIPVGLDVAYIGTTVDIKPLGATTTGRLVGTNVEGALRWNILPHYVWNPYIFAGVGWQRYDVTNVDYSRADTGLADKDNLAVYPVGAGIAYRDRRGFVADVRSTFRAAQDSGLLREASGSNAKLHTWDASAQVGYEF